MTATFNLLLGDCLKRLKELPDNSIDSIVTDPPYGLSKQPDMVEVLKHWLAGEDYQHNSKGFMGKEWDSFVPGPAIWKECLRVLKPGGHMVAFFGTRTYDIGVLAIRLAGFEIRNQLVWVFGSGFPKSLDVSKAIDKTLGAEREIVGKRTYGDGHIQNSNASIGFGGSDPVNDDRSISAPATDAAKQWEGWGTDLKPAMEPIVLARKPLEGTVANNVMKHGVGGINIDGCRVESVGETISNHGRNDTSKNSNGWGVSLSPYQDREQTEGQKLGRFPANFIHDGSDEVAALFPITKSGSLTLEHQKNGGYAGKNDSGIYGSSKQGGSGVYEGNEGSAARFFYCAKTSKKDRNEGLDHLLDKDGDAAASSNNNHPTVKPTALMEYLCRLITPDGGTILDPFMGSGSTGKAAMYEGFNFVGIELLQEYMKIAEARIAAARKDAHEISVGLKKPSKKAYSSAKTEDDADLSSFL